MGKDGSQWKHGYIPENAIATALKMHRKPGSSGSTAKPKASASKTVKPKAPKPSGGQLSKGYVQGKGASNADVSALIRNFTIMHGKPPTAKQIAKIKKAK